MDDKQTLRRKFRKGTLFFMNHPEEVKTPDYTKFVKDVVIPLNKILLAELRETESKESLEQVDLACKMFNGLVIKVKEHESNQPHATQNQ